MGVILSYPSMDSIVVAMLPIFIRTLQPNKSCVLCLVSCVLASYPGYASHNLLCAVVWVVSICANRPTWGIQVAEAWSALEGGGAGSDDGERPGGRLVSELVARLVSAIGMSVVVVYVCIVINTSICICMSGCMYAVAKDDSYNTHTSANTTMAIIIIHTIYFILTYFLSVLSCPCPALSPPRLTLSPSTDVLYSLTMQSRTCLSLVLPCLPYVLLEMPQTPSLRDWGVSVVVHIGVWCLKCRSRLSNLWIWPL